MPTIVYDHTFNYPRDGSGGSFPILPIRLQFSARAVDTMAYLDSGAEYSLFQAELATAIALDPIGGAQRRYALANGQEVAAAVREVTVSHPQLGNFSLSPGFSFGLTRNILGRDFFNFVQIGFREQYLQFFVTSAP